MHAANSAAVLRGPEAHFDMVRCGISIYGMDPFGVDALAQELEPVLELSSYVAEVKPCGPGQSAGYGRTFRGRGDTAIALLPIGYGDGWRRALSNNGEVLIAGRRYPLAGTVSMDSITVEVGADAARGRAARRAGGADRLRRGRADQRRGGRPAPGDDQLRGHLRAHPAGAEDLPPRRRRGGRAARRMSRGTDRRLSARRSSSPGARSPAARRGSSGAPPATGCSGGPAPTSTWSSTETWSRPPGRSPGRPPAAPASSCPPTTAPGGWSAPSTGWQADFEPLRAPTLEQDLRLRDFTVNAIAEPLAGGEPIDPLGGHRGPARAAPARRLARRLPGRPAAGHAPGPGGRRARPRARARDARARRAPPRRGCGRCRPSGCSRSCAGSSPRSGPPRRRTARRRRRERAVLPELEQLRGVQQSRYHHADVYVHTLEVLERTVALTHAGDAPPARPRPTVRRASAGRCRRCSARWARSCGRAWQRAGRAARRRADPWPGAGVGRAAARRRQAGHPRAPAPTARG